jgi:hypothetical protein
VNECPIKNISSNFIKHFSNFLAEIAADVGKARSNIGIKSDMGD